MNRPSSIAKTHMHIAVEMERSSQYAADKIIVRAL
jgi:hypothetical protein